MDKAPVLRDLQWLATSQPLLTGNCGSIDLVREASEAILENPDLLEQTTWIELQESKNGRLGSYFEKLIFHTIDQSPKVNAILTNIQVMEGRRTLGEFDCIYCTDEGWIHLELAVKYYLGLGDPTCDFNWHGPALRDNLGKKLQRLNEHQLVLPTTEAGKAVLKANNIDSLQGSDTMIFGCLFLPYQQSGPLPGTIRKECDTGWWITEDDWHAKLMTCGLNWRFVWKLDWFSPIHTSGTGNLESPLEQPTMAIGFDGDKLLERGFVVPNNWGQP